MFDFEMLKDPGYFRENRLDPHSDHAYYLSEAERDSGKMSLRESLNGLWKFFYAQNPGQVIPGFESADFNCHGWRDIPVPAHIQLEGYGAPQYANVEYPWDGIEDGDLRPGELPERFNPVGCYVKYFFLPKRMKNRRVFISFQGVESCVALWLNGKYIGFSSDSFTPHEFELTDALVDGENKLACRVYRWCAGSWLEDQDFLRFSGIFRDVYLFTIPQSHVWDLQVTAEPEQDGRIGRLKWQAKVEAPDGAQLTVALKGVDGTVEKAVWDDDDVTAEGEITVDSPRLWSAEDPWLYDLDVTLAGLDGETEYIRQKVGFRKIEIADGVMKVNGVRVVFKGVNRHDFCGETGRAVPEEKVREALLLMKRNNINAIRTSHYPNASVLYRLADELGLYVIDECNMESHGMWDRWLRGGEPMFPGDRMEWAPLLLDRVRSMVGRDRNHPSIIIWSCGNESMTGQVILAMSREFKKLDPTRLVHYEGDSHAGGENRIREITDIETEMYTPAAKIRAYLKEHREKPFILCEYTHSMGNSNGAMHKYTEMAYEEPLYQGGFIWDYIDQGIAARDRFGRDTLQYGGDWDDRPTDGIFCGNGIVFADGRPTPKLQEVKYNYQNIRVDVEGNRAEIANRHMFTDTSAYRCLVTLEREGKEIGRWEMETAVPPLSSQTVTLPFDLPEAAGEYAATVSFRLREDEPWADAGYEVAFGQGVWKVEAEKVCEGEHRELFYLASPWNITVRGDSFQLMFSKINGAVNSYKWGDVELLKQPLVPNFWRAPINNDNGNGMPQRYAQWKIASMYARPGITPETREKNGRVQPVRASDGSVSFTLTWDLPTNPAASVDVTYRVHPCGKVDVRMVYEPVAGLGDMPEFGMLMKLDADYDRVRFLGLGPDENYCDRKEGARLGIWQYRAAENMTPYLLPQECGNRTGVRWAEVTNVRGHGLKLWLNEGEFSALPWTPHEIENAAHGYELPPVVYTVLKMSAQQMGVGGDDSWGARTHEEYLLDVSGTKVFEFSFKGI